MAKIKPTYLRPFISSCHRNTYSSHPLLSFAPNTWNLLPLHDSEEIRWELLTPWRSEWRIPPLDSECLSSGVHRQALLTHVFRDVVNAQDVILLIQYSANDKWKSGKNWRFINKPPDSSNPEELPTNHIYIHPHIYIYIHVHSYTPRSPHTPEM